MTAKLTFEELPDGSRIITVQGINQFGEKYIRQDRIKCPAVWEALKRLTYTADETEAFAEWCSKNKWYAFGQEEHMWYNYTKQITKTTVQLREMWEQERRVK